ncbi:transmembrane protein stas [Dermatophagoides farinae]|uniref:Transmembrane protein 41B n=1 Tax=Dermatophagoides farinae TaxID=6954 RepID=A0A922IFB7_DERFA|nr:transmembrane protein 41B-like [Dermatophagoides farinae]KAH7642260.1 transmembrane protein 41b-like protein [Dermatophagoides farinae]KAH9529461.1 Transmembrane protein 41B [Dermatophagoides farinae]
MVDVSPSSVQSPETQNRKDSLQNSSLLLLSIILISTLSLFIVYLNFPKLEPHEKQHFKLPMNIDDAKNLGNVLSGYKDRYFYVVLFGFIVTYIFLQSFAIPGSIFLSVMSGYLFPLPLALLSVCFCSAVGASICYLLSCLCGRPFIIKYWPDKANVLSNIIDQHRSHLFYYMIFLRITPFLPNWFINITSPIVDVPLSTFFIGTFLGVAPPSFIAVHAGTTLYQLTSSSNIISFQSMMMLLAFSLLSLTPIILKRIFADKFKKP